MKDRILTVVLNICVIAGFVLGGFVGHRFKPFGTPFYTTLCNEVVNSAVFAVIGLFITLVILFLILFAAEVLRDVITRFKKKEEEDISE